MERIGVLVQKIKVLPLAILKTHKGDN